MSHARRLVSHGIGAALLVPALLSCRSEPPPAATALAPPERDVFQQDVAWSPDGHWLGDGKDQIYVVDVESGAELAITADAANNIFPSFLPNGEIAFASKEGEGASILASVEADGSRRRRIGTWETFFARWSPDGESIAFISGEWPRSAIYIERRGRPVQKLVN